MSNNTVVGWSTLPLIDSKIVTLNLDKLKCVKEDIQDNGKYVYLVLSKNGKNISVRTPTQFFVTWREMDPIDQKTVLDEFKKEII